MYKYIIFLVCFGPLFSLDSDWATYEGHEISLNTIIIKIDDDYAPKLGTELPLTMQAVLGLKDLDQFNNFKDFNPLFKGYQDFTVSHRDHDLHLYYTLSFETAEKNLLGLRMIKYFWL